MLRQASISCVSLIVALALLPAHAGQRAFVSSTGNDANLAAGCTLASPCRTFQTAHTAVDAGGEIVALDAAGYAPVTITKSVSIIGNPGFVAGIAVTSGNGVTIATPGVNVVLRNLSINATGGLDGVSMTAGDSLNVENCVISNLPEAGIKVTTAADVRIVGSLLRGNLYGAIIAGNASAEVVNSRFMGNLLVGFWLKGDGGGTASASVSDSVASRNTIGFIVTGTSGFARMSLIRATSSNNFDTAFRVAADGDGTFTVMTVGSSMASGSSVGFDNFACCAGTATFESLGDNIVRHTPTPTRGTITAVSGL